MTTSLPRSAALLIALVLAIGASACSASVEVESSAPSVGDPVVAQPTATPAPEAAPTAVAPTDTTETETETETESAGEAPDATSNGSVEIAFDDGRSWSLNTIDCYTAPESAFGVFFMAGVNDDGADFGAVETWPLDGDRSGGTSFIASFTDEEGALYIVEGGPVTENGESLSFSSPIYEGLSLEPSTTGTFSCTP